MLRNNFMLYMLLPMFCSGTALCFDMQTAGSFYPREREKLGKMVEGYIADAELPEQITSDKRPILGIISPHAGYVFSGPVAGYGYRLLSAHKQDFDTVIVLALSHHYPFSGITVLNDTSYKTPLGTVPIDQELSKAFLTLDFAVSNNEYFGQEHSLEVQLPFLQKALGDFKAVCVLFGQCDLAMLEKTGDFLYSLREKYPQKRMLVVASTDLSHFHSYDAAQEKDRRTMEIIRQGKAAELWKEYKVDKAELCGIMPVAAFLRYVEKAGGTIAVLKYLNSGDVYYDKNRVVGYVSAVAFAGKETRKKSTEEAEFSLSKEEQEQLLTIARQTITEYVKNKKVPDFSVGLPLLLEKKGAFVTLKKHGDLRGCIGRIVADKPLWEAVREMSIEAALHDPRFPPVTANELKDITIEISVLSDFIKVNDPEEIKVGRDGLMIRRGFYSGLLLPQVPGEWGWDKETFLKQLCLKAGLPTTAYRDKNATLYRFTAFVFGE